MTIKSSTQFLSYIILAAALSACGSSSTDSDGEAVVSDSVKILEKEKDTRAQNVFNSIPSPLAATALLQQAGAKYNAKFLNPIENVSKYSSVKTKALNLGVYGTDLSFTSLFDQTQESMLYLRCNNKLAGSLGIVGAFDESTSSRIEANMDNRDSLLSIIASSYKNADNYLKENGQPGVSALIIAGGWIEGLYIATQIANTYKNDQILPEIAKQKKSLDDIVGLLESNKSNNEGIAEVLTDLTSLKKIFDTIQPAIGENANTSTAGAAVPPENTSTITPDQLKQISNKITEVRNKTIQ